MIPEDVRPILQTLIERSKRREVEWITSSAAGQRHGDYVVLFPSSSFVLAEDQDEGRIEGRILNSRGDTALTFGASYRDSEDDYGLLAELMELARRKVLKADEALAEIKKVLELSGRIGEIPKANVGGPPEDEEEVPF